MVEEMIKRHEFYPTRKMLWNSLHCKMQYKTFSRVLDDLESSGKILVDRDEGIVWTFPDNEKLEKLLKSSTKLR